MAGTSGMAGMSDPPDSVENIRSIKEMVMTATTTVSPPDAQQPPSHANQEESARRLEEQICGMASQIATFTCRFLELLSSFDEVDGWQRRGFTSASHWLSWRCGMSPTTAREHIRVARTLPDLPLIRADFAAGLLSYSKVRALTRVATPETEEDLLGVARGASASQLDRFISGLRRAGELDDGEDAYSQRRVTWRVDEDGEVHLSARLSPEDGAVVIEALQATRDYLQNTDPNRPHSVGADRSAPTASDSAAIRDEAEDQRTFADALVQICAEGTPTEASEPAHGSRRSETVVHATLEQLAQVGVASEQDSSARLELGPALHPETARRLTCDTGVVLHLHDGDDTYNAVPNTHPGQTIDVGQRTRTPNAALMRALWIRDQGCRFPACGRRRYIHAHHVRHWAHGGPTELDNLVLLCGQHHRLLHEGGYSLSMHEDHVQVFDPEGAPLPGQSAISVAAPAETDASKTDPGGALTDEVGDRDKALSPVNAGPLNLAWAVSVIADNWYVRRRLAAGWSTYSDPAA